MANLKTAQEAGANFVSGSSSKQGNYQSGINRTSENPMAKAASPEAQAKYVANTAKAANSGRMSRRLMETSFEEWKRLSVAKAGNWAQGVSLAREKYIRAMQGVFSHMQTVIASLPPRGNTEQNIQRSAEYQRKMAQYHEQLV